VSEATEFLSPEWMEALGARLGSAEVDVPATTIVIEYRVRGDGGVVTYHVDLGPDGASVAAGPAPEPTVMFTMDRATAAAINGGELSAEEAFITGRLDLEGDASAIIHAHRAARDA
jgi:hypothetical protein